jgi:hypothetical protein
MSWKNENPGPYARDIMKLFDCSAEDAFFIEEMMRNEVLQGGCLDGLSGPEFNRAARKGRRIFEDDREFFEQAYAERRAFFQKCKSESEAIAKAVTYEI